MFETDRIWRMTRLGLGSCVLVAAISSPAVAVQEPGAAPVPAKDPPAPTAAPPAPQKKRPGLPPAASRPKRPVERALTIEQIDAASVLDSLIEQARAIDDQATRIRVEGRVAELLYERNPERARKLFRRAFDEIESLNESSVDPTVAPVGARLTLRVELLSTLYGVDPVLAGQLAATLDEDPENYDGGGLPFESQSDMSATMLRVAQSLAADDPQLASSLARQGISAGVPVEFGILLPALGEADRAVADELAGEAIRIAGTSGSSLVDLAGAMPYVFPELEGYGPRPPGAATRSSDLRRAFLAAALNVTSRFANGLNARLTQAQTEGGDPWSIYAGEGLAVNFELAEQIGPLFDAVDPERSGAFRGLTAQIANAMPVDLRASIGASLPKAGVETAESIAAKAESLTDRNAREELFGRAAALAADRGDVDLAKSYASRIEDPARRSSVRSAVALQGISTALAERRYDDARRLAAEIPDLRSRASAYIRISAEMASSGKRALAAECLEDAQVALVRDGAVMTREKAEALVRVANAYAALDPMRGFEVMRSALDAVNTGQRRFEGGGAAQSQSRRNPGLVYELSALDPSSGLEALARADYYRSMGLAQKLDSKALAVLAQIGAIRGVLKSRRATTEADRPPAGTAAPAVAPVPAVKPAPAARPPAGAPVVAPVAPGSPESAGVAVPAEEEP